MLRNTDAKEPGTNTQNSGTTATGQWTSFFGGGLVGLLAYNAYHRPTEATQESSTPKLK